MKINFWKGMGGICENCGKPIKNVYIIEDAGINFKVGSECVKKYITVNDVGMKYIEKQIKDSQKYLDKKENLIKGLENNNIALLSKILRDLRTESEIIENAKQWIKTCEYRSNKILDEMNEKLRKSNIKLKKEIAR